MGMVFEWDEANDLANQRKHGLSFDDAIEVFDDPLRPTRCDRIERGEVRYQTRMNAILRAAMLLAMAEATAIDKAA